MADQKTPKPTVKLWITSCVPGYSGVNSRGEEFTIYNVQAQREDKAPITDKKLRSFEELSIGELTELTVTRFESEKHGVSFTLAKKGVGAHQRINDLAAKVKAQDERISRLEAATSSAGQRERLDEQFGAAPPY